MRSFVSSPDHLNIFALQHIHILLNFCNFDVAVENVSFAANQGDILIDLLLRVARIINNEVSDKGHYLIIVVSQLNLLHRTVHNLFT